MRASYHNDGNFFYKVEENKLTTVCTIDSYLRVEITIGNTSLIEYAQEFDEVSSHEFNHAAAQVIQVLNEKIFN
jgi:hypothetical protein